MKKLPLLEESTKIWKEILEIYKDLDIKNNLLSNEKEEIVWSVKYNLCVKWDNKLDLDIWIISPNPREATLRIGNLLTEKMLRNKLFKKMNINNFYDVYEEFEKKKAELIKIEQHRFFMINLEYNLDESLENKINYEFHISEKMQKEEFEEIINLSDQDKEKLLELKYFVYKDLPHFWNRSYLVYKWFLSWVRTKEWMLDFLQENWYENLIN